MKNSSADIKNRNMSIVKWQKLRGHVCDPGVVRRRARPKQEPGSSPRCCNIYSPRPRTVQHLLRQIYASANRLNPFGV